MFLDELYFKIRKEGQDLIQRLISDGEFGWGGTSVKEQRRCPKMSSVRTEISGRTEG